jgi:tRNA pseudouridine55 synthase
MDTHVTGILNLYKMRGITSRKAVDGVKRLLPRIKAGHAGTLDPLAAGVLIVCVGSATRLIESVQRMVKVYRTVVRLGARSDTLDAEGSIRLAENPGVPTEAAVRCALAAQIGAITQRPPEYSALKVNGRRAYDLARAGRAIELRARIVRIDRIELLCYRWPYLELEIECGAGTYIRSIARDLGEALGCGGLVFELVRTRIGPFSTDSSLHCARLTEDALERHLQPPLHAVPDLPRVFLDADQSQAITAGRPIDSDTAELGSAPRGEIALLDAEGRLLAIGRADSASEKIYPSKVLMSGNQRI